MLILIKEVYIYNNIFYNIDKNEIENKISEEFRTYKMKDHTNGIYSEDTHSIHFAGVSPGYLFSFSYSDSIDDCEVITNTIDNFIEDDKSNVTTFDIHENTNTRNLLDFCFSARFDNNNVFCGDYNYNGNILIDEYLDYEYLDNEYPRLFLLPLVSIYILFNIINSLFFNKKQHEFDN